MRIKRTGAALLALMLCVGRVSAYGAGAAEPVQEEKTAAAPAPMDPLTPEGNLSLVDDEGGRTEEGKQFITVVTKAGNYFYLIIDRDAQGKQTVHFLNQVDEADLLRLMDEKEIQKLTPIVKEPEPEPKPEPEAAPPAPDPQPPKRPNVLPSLLALGACAGGLGIFGLNKWKESRKKQEQDRPDPDADYLEEYDEEEPV